jgi:hypothetical protein
LREEHRVVRRDGVEVSCGNETAFGELAFVPAAALDPCTFRRRGDFGADRCGDVGDAFDGRVAEVDDVEAVGAAAGEVGVGVE